MLDLLLMHYKNIYSANIDIRVDVTGTVYEFPYTGSVQTINLWPGTYKLEVWGAEGGYRSSTSYSGKGGYSVGTLTLTDEETKLFIYSGGSGRTGGTAGGFNGGGKRSSYYGGGGASDIRIGQDSLYSRVIVAGGGGSDGASNKAGGYGGGTSGQARTESYGSGGFAGTQTGVSNTSWQTNTRPTSTTTKAGAYAGFGFGGNGIKYSSGYGGAGGGGWYGGSGSYPDGSGDDDRGGGGGSGYVYNSNSAKNYPAGCLLTSKYYLTDTAKKAGNTSFVKPAGGNETGHKGNGYCRITVLSGYGKVQPKLYKSEYVEGKGDDYILTDIYPSNNMARIEYKIKINETGVTKGFFGARAVNSQQGKGICLWSISGKIRKDYNLTSTTENTIVANTIYEGEITQPNTNAFNCQYPISLCSVNNIGNSDTYMGKVKIYYIKIYDSTGTLIHNLQPYYYGDNIGCMKDMVTKKVYYSKSEKITGSKI